MIKIGKGYFDSNFRWGIFPACSDEGSYIVALESGVKANVTVRQDELEHALASAGFEIENASDGDAADLHLDPYEVNELYGAYVDDFKYVVKDVREIVFAFQDRPFREGVYWSSDSGSMKRLTGDYSFLDKDSPMLIVDILSSSGRCDAIEPTPF